MKSAWVVVALVFASSGSRATSLGEASREVLEGRARTVRVELTDAVAAQVRKVTQSPSPVFAQISAVRDFPEPSCKRLKVVITAPEALVAKNASGEPVPFAYEMEINLCANGYPPAAR